MDLILGLTLMVGALIFGAIILIKNINDRYPILVFDIRDRGLLISNIKYREFGKIIVKDDLIGILLGTYRICGMNKEYYEYIRTPNGGKIYQAVLRHDFLCAIDYKDPEKQPQYKQLKILIDKNLADKIVGQKLTLLGNPTLEINDYMLNPIKMEFANENISERSIGVPRDIATRFVEHIKSSQSFTNASNPIMAVLISSLPLGIVVLLTCILVYVLMMGFNSSAVEMLKTSQEIITLLKTRGA